jgi:hypothetical protein
MRANGRVPVVVALGASALSGGSGVVGALLKDLTYAVGIPARRGQPARGTAGISECAYP